VSAEQDSTIQPKTRFPLLPLRDVVVYPHMVIPLFVGRERSINALEEAMKDDKQVLLVAQKHAGEDNPELTDIYEIGAIATILQLLKLPDGTVKVLVEGSERVTVTQVDNLDSHLQGSVEKLVGEQLSSKEEELLAKSLLEQFEEYVGQSKKVPPEVMTSLNGIDDAGRLADTIAAHMSLSIEKKQAILELADVGERVEHMLGLLNAEADVFSVEKRIRGRVKKQMEKSQREYYLNEQMKAIQKELGDMDEAPNEFEALQKKIDEAGMSAEALE
jgi:ATP-dependent Lon protease